MDTTPHPSYLIETPLGELEITPASGQEVYIASPKALAQPRQPCERGLATHHRFQIIPGRIKYCLLPTYGWEVHSFSQYRYVADPLRPGSENQMVPDKIMQIIEPLIRTTIALWIDRNPRLVLQAEYISEINRASSLQAQERKLKESLTATQEAFRASIARINAQANALSLLSITPLEHALPASLS